MKSATWRLSLLKGDGEVEGGRKGSEGVAEGAEEARNERGGRDGVKGREKGEYRR